MASDYPPLVTLYFSWFTFEITPLSLSDLNIWSTNFLHVYGHLIGPIKGLFGTKVSGSFSKGHCTHWNFQKT